MTASNSFGKRLKKLRESKGFSQSDLADKCGLWDREIQRYEAGRGLPGLENIVSLVKALEIPADVLLGTVRP